MDRDFLGGVVEGFYGQPWTHTQRFELFRQMAAWGLNTYFYSPKDDLKHRAIWRECYSDRELVGLAELVNECGKLGLRFIYGLSPGLDIRFADDSELAHIQARFDQLIHIGVRDFALLFDDLPGEMHGDDRNAFASVAAAQASVTNLAFTWLRAQFPDSRLLFCPTPYCDRMVGWDLGGANYLDTVGRLLDVEIDFLWTGPEIISETIPVESIHKLAERIGRKPVIWDNLHANDYDMRRLYCGPYSGRPPELLDVVQGILANPNNEFWINYVPLMTFAHFMREPQSYDPRQAYLASVKEWAGLHETVNAPILEADIHLLADCYYLPHEHGEGGQRLQQLIERLIQEPSDTWKQQHQEFVGLHCRIQRIFESLTRLKNRELFYAWSRRVWELKEELDLIGDFLEGKKSGKLSASGLASQTHLRKTYRGGLVAELQRLLVMDADGRIRPA